MKLGKIFTSSGKYLKVEDLKKRRVVVKIVDVSIDDMGDGKKKPVLHFENSDRTLPLNITNANMMAMLTGSDDTDDWPGTRVTLRPDMTTFQGKPTPCIRIDSELPPQKRGATAPRQPPPPPEEEEDFGEPASFGAPDDEDGDSVPF